MVSYTNFLSFLGASQIQISKANMIVDSHINDAIRFIQSLLSIYVPYICLYQENVNAYDYCIFVRSCRLKFSQPYMFVFVMSQ